MKWGVIVLVCLGLGLGLGWYVGCRQTADKSDRDLLREFHETKQQDEFAAGVALAAFANLQAGRPEKAEHELATTVSIYYRAHRLDGNTNLITSIEAYAATNTVMSNAIYRPIK